MACTVYCLVPDPEQLDLVVERLKDAGVKTQDIAVVPRRHWMRPPTPASTPSAQAGADALPIAFWSLSLTPATWWWRWALGLPATSGEPAPARHAVIPLQLYERKGGAIKGG